LEHKISQPVHIFNRENSQNSESPNGPRRGLDFIALLDSNDVNLFSIMIFTFKKFDIENEKFVTIH
jgi:hypothetical protein